MAGVLNHTGEQLDEAIGLVLAGYADVSGTTATESDVVAGKKFTKANGAEATGTMPQTTVEAEVTVSGAILQDEETDTAVVITATADIDQAGYADQGDQKTVTKYVKTEQKTATGNGVVLPSSGRLLSRVTVSIPDAIIGLISELESTVLGDTVSNYPVKHTVAANTTPGIVGDDTVEDEHTEYIQTEARTFTDNGSYSPTPGKLIETVNVAIPERVVTPSAEASGPFVAEDPTPGYIDITPKATIPAAGLVRDGAVGSPIRVYINTAEATLTANGEYTPPAGKLYSRIYVNVPRAKLNAPSVSISGRVLTIQDGNNGTFCDTLNVVLDGVIYAGLANTGEPITVTLPEMEIGQHTVQVYADGTGIDESDPAEVIYNVQAFMTVDGKYFKTADGKFFVVKTEE